MKKRCDNCEKVTRHVTEKVSGPEGVFQVTRCLDCNYQVALKISDKKPKKRFGLF